MAKEIMNFRGKNVDESMTKQELLEVIEYLAFEVVELRTERNEFSDVIYREKINRPGLERKWYTG